MHKKWKRFLAVSLAVLLIVSAPMSANIFAGFALTASAASYSGTCGEKLTWTLDTDTGILAITGTGEMKNYYSGAPWDSYRSSIWAVRIADSVTSIGDGAFYYCTRLTSVTIPDSVTSIGAGAFYHTGIYNNASNWENDVLYIGNHLIKAKTSITGDYLVKSGTKTIADYAFCECTSLTSVTIPDSVTSIGERAFYDCTGLTSITIPDSVISIGNSAFEDCTSLTSVTIPDSVTSIGDWVFFQCTRLTSITVNESNPNYSSDEYGVLLNKDKTMLIQYPVGNTRTSYTIPDSVTSIGGRAFYRCTSLTSVTIPDSVTSIGYDAFYNTEIYNNASNWENDVLYIGNHLIKVKTSITGGYLVRTGTKTIADDAFFDCTRLTSVAIPDSVTSIGDYAFSWCTSLTSVTIGDSVTSIGNGAFHECTRLTSVTIPDSVTSIGEWTFSHCTSLTSITVKEGNPKYSSDEYGVLLNKDKTLLIQYPIGNTRTSYTIPDSVTSIGNSAFYHCISLTSVTIPDGVTSIDDYVIANCTSLTSVTIPDSVTSIDDYVFANCTSLTSVTIPDSVTSIGDGAFEYCTRLTSVTIGDSVTSIGERAFYDCAGLTSVTIGDSVTSIGFYAFHGCTRLTSVTIPNGVTSIGADAFADCSSLNYVHIPASVTTIGSSILYDSSAYICSDTEECYAKKYAEVNGIEFRVCEGHIPPHDHNYVSSVTAPTCTEQGYTTHTCTTCGDTYTDNVVDALGHSYKSVVTAPTCTEQGYTTHTCTVCGDSYRDSFVAPLPAIFIRNFKGEITVDYRTTVTFAAEVPKPIDGAEIHWFVDGKDMGTGDTYTVKEAKKDINVQARYMEGKTVIAESEIETVKVKSGFFDKLKAFFRALFKKLPVLTQEYLGIERITTR